MPTLGDENIGGLDVAMHDTPRMSGIESIGDLHSQIQNLFHLQRLAPDQMLQRLAFQ
jgi:hypothetical protein